MACRRGVAGGMPPDPPGVPLKRLARGPTEFMAARMAQSSAGFPNVWEAIEPPNGGRQARSGVEPEVLGSEFESGSCSSCDESLRGPVTDPPSGWSFFLNGPVPHA